MMGGLAGIATNIKTFLARKREVKIKNKEIVTARDRLSVAFFAI
jgi:hypothetical protein